MNKKEKYVCLGKVKQKKEIEQNLNLEKRKKDKRLVNRKNSIEPQDSRLDKSRIFNALLKNNKLPFIVHATINEEAVLLRWIKAKNIEYAWYRD